MKSGESVRRKTYEGVVVSSKMNKVAVVLLERFVLHPLYKKRIKRSKKVFVRDETNLCKEGDKVRFENSRPYSKRTAFKLISVVEKGEDRLL